MNRMQQTKLAKTDKLVVEGLTIIIGHLPDRFSYSKNDVIGIPYEATYWQKKRNLSEQWVFHWSLESINHEYLHRIVAKEISWESSACLDNLKADADGAGNRLTLETGAIAKSRVEKLFNLNHSLLRDTHKRGFHHCFRNYTHDKHVYTKSEQLFKTILDKHHIQPYLHEYRVQFNRDGKKHHYWLDFYFPLHKVCVEINPQWHSKYAPVVKRDTLRTELLETRNHITVVPVNVHGRQINGRWEPTLNQSDITKALTLLQKRMVSPETLSFYTKGAS